MSVSTAGFAFNTEGVGAADGATRPAEGGL